MREFQESLDNAVGRRWRKVIVAICVLIAVWIVAALIFGMWPFSAAVGVAKRVINPDAIIQNYQWYYDQYNAIQAQKANLATLDKTARERPGLLMVLNSMIGEYNSRSKQITRNLWKAVDLPYQINMEDGK